MAKEMVMPLYELISYKEEMLAETLWGANWANLKPWGPQDLGWQWAAAAGTTSRDSLLNGLCSLKQQKHLIQSRNVEVFHDLLCFLHSTTI